MNRSVAPIAVTVRRLSAALRSLGVKAWLFLPRSRLLGISVLVPLALGKLMIVSSGFERRFRPVSAVSVFIHGIHVRFEHQSFAAARRSESEWWKPAATRQIPRLPRWPAAEAARRRWEDRARLPGRREANKDTAARDGTLPARSGVHPRRDLECTLTLCHGDARGAARYRSRAAFASDRVAAVDCAAVSEAWQGRVEAQDDQRRRQSELACWSTPRPGAPRQQPVAAPSSGTERKQPWQPLDDTCTRILLIGAASVQQPWQSHAQPAPEPSLGLRAVGRSRR